MFLAGIVSMLFGQGRGIMIGIVGFALSKVIIAAWTIARPQSQAAHRSTTSLLLVAIVWGAVAIYFVAMELNK
jgi:hypothetical protein